MATLDNLFLESELSLAAYANLTVGEPNKQSLKDAGMPDIQATRFASRWRVVDQVNSPVTGLSATVFKQISTGKSYLAIRGTDEMLDLVTDLISVGVVGTTVWQGQYSILSAKVKAWLANGALPLSFTVTGHSLGGFLATGIAAEFSANVEHAYLYNAPGLNGILGIATAPILRALRIVVPGAAAKLSNIKADAGISPIAGLGAQLAPPVRVLIENQFNSDVLSPPAARNHSQETLTDALALYALLGSIDPTISIDQISDCLKAASAQNNRTLENCLDALRRNFGLGDATPTGNRESFYNNIYSLQANPLFQSIANSDAGSNATAGRIVSLVSVDVNQLVARARSDFGYLFALNTLSPFAIIRANNIFRTEHGELYDQWQADQSLTAADRAAGWGTFSDTYLQDRAQFLAWKNQKNLNDLADDVSIRRKDNGAESYLYTDKTLKDSQGQDYSIRVVGGNVLQQVDSIRISFASDQGDTLAGGNYADHLYGGKGSDTLAGGEGNDYLEGGAGDDTLRGDPGVDTLIGGSGADTLIGGAGDDSLRGGKGDDILQGGAGDDVYLLNAGDGRDTIVDHEGRNTIIYTDASGRRSALGVPAFAVAEASNTWNGRLAGDEAVTFTRNSPLTATLADGSQIVIDGYQDGDFGIQLKNLAQSELTDATIRGDLEPVHFFQQFEQGVEVYWQPDVDALGNIITDPSKPAPNTRDVLYGSSGNDFIAGFGGDDLIYGGDGADRLQGGTGLDIIHGEAGDDVIEGEDGSSTDAAMNILDGGAGDDTLFATTESDIEAALAHANDAAVESDGGWLFGGPGDDVIVGSNGMDMVFGGQGADVLIGGAGDDYIVGETDITDGVDPYYGTDPGTAADDGDWIYGGGGSDWIRAGLGDDYVDGGDGNDMIFGDGGADLIFGGAGNDYILAMANPAVYDESDDYIDGGDGNDHIFGSDGDNILLGGAGGDVIGGRGGDDFIDGGPGNDQIQGNNAHGGAGDDRIAGTSGADTLYGDDGDDVLAGWKFLMTFPGDPGYVPSTENFGDDWLYGGAGDDTYLFALGTGTAHIVDDSGVNRIVLKSYETNVPVPGASGLFAPIASDRIHLELQDGTYKLIYGDIGDCVDLGVSPGGAMPVISLNRVRLDVRFDDTADAVDPVPPRLVEISSEMVSLPVIALSQESTTAGSTLVAVEGYASTLTGNAGDDMLIGASGADVLIGGPGNDTLDGGEGGDRYVFNAADGVDVVSDSGTRGSDTLVFGTGITPESLSLGTEGPLLIRIGGSRDAVYVDGFDPDDAGTGGGVENFEFADGSVLTHAQLVDRGFDLLGTDGDDTAFGTNLVDRFHESAGDDIVVGGAGDDVYYFGVGSGHDIVIDSDATPNNSDTVVLGDGIAPDNLVVLSSAGMLSLALSGTNDRLDLQWQPQDGYAIERVQFADGTIWDSAMLESQAVPAPQADAGSGASEGGGAPAADAGSADAGASASAGSDPTPGGSGNTPALDAGSADADTGAPTGGATTQTANGGPPSADVGAPDALAGTPAADDVARIGEADTSLADGRSLDAVMAASAADNASWSSEVAARLAIDRARGLTLATLTGNNASPTREAGATSADAAALSVDGHAPDRDDAVPAGSASAPAVEGGPYGVEAGAPFDGGTAPTAMGGGAASDGSGSSRGGPAPAGADGTSQSRNPQTAMSQSEQGTLVAATSVLGAIDAATSAGAVAAAAVAASAAPVISRSIGQAFDVFNAHLGDEQATFSPSPASFFTRLRPTQPNLQSWLDNWLGPGGRVTGGARETSRLSSDTPADDDPSPLMQEFSPPNLPSDIPEMQPTELLTPEQIAQHYDDIALWFDANPGVEPGMAGASLPERNPFRYIGAGFAGDSAFVSMPAFGQTAGMAALGGHELAPLRGIKDGYSLLGVI